MNVGSKNRRTKIPQVAYTIAFTGSLSGGFYGPYIAIYAVELGASYAEIGIVSAVSNVSPMILQPLWGYLSDRMLMRKVFIVLGNIIAGLLILLYPLAHEPLLYAALIMLSMAALSASTPAWSAYIGSFLDKHERARGLGRIGGVGLIGTIIGTLVTGFLMTKVIGEGNPMQYVLAFVVAGIFRIISGLLALAIKEPLIVRKNNYDISLLASSILRNDHFKRLLLAESLGAFSLSIAWPMFSAAYIYKFHATKLQIAVANVLSNIALSIGQLYLGFLADRYGRRQVLVIMRFAFPMYALAWYYARDIEYIYLANFLIGFVNAIVGVAVPSYILDISEEDERASYFAVHNMILGISQFIGSYIGGLLGDQLSHSIGALQALQTVILISAVLRLLAVIPYFLLKETVKISDIQRALSLDSIRRN